MNVQDDTPEPGRAPLVYPRNPPRNLLRGSALLHPSNLYAVEGLEGAGKSTLVKRLVRELNSQGRTTVVATLRGSDIVLHALERAKWKNADPITFNLLNWCSLFDQACDLGNVINGEAIVLFDRYTLSVAVRGMLEGMDEKLLSVLEPLLPQPRKIFFINSDPKICLERVISSGRSVSYYEAGARDVAIAGDPMTEADEIVRWHEYDRTELFLRHLHAMRGMYYRVLEGRDNVVLVDNSGDIETSFKTIFGYLD